MYQWLKFNSLFCIEMNATRRHAKLAQEKSTVVYRQTLPGDKPGTRLLRLLHIIHCEVGK